MKSFEIDVLGIQGKVHPKYNALAIEVKKKNRNRFFFITKEALCLFFSKRTKLHVLK